MTEQLTSADPRPNDEPFYIDSECPECGTELVLLDKHRNEEVDEEDIWHDEWTCPSEDCDREGVFMDWPEERWEAFQDRLERAGGETLVGLEELKEEMEDD